MRKEEKNDTAAINPKTRKSIEIYLELFIIDTVEQNRDLEDSGQNHNPFYSALVADEISKISAFQRSITNHIESTFVEIALLIALDHHAEAKRRYEVRGSVSQAAINEIEQQVENFERAAEGGASKPSLDDMIKAVLQARKTDDERFLSLSTDLYVHTDQEEELFFIIASPFSAKQQCIEGIRRILQFHLLRGQPRPQVQGYFAMPYNPFGYRDNVYQGAIATTYLPFEEVALVGYDFWNILGGPTAYTELLEIYREIGDLKSKYVIDALYYGFTL